MSAAGKFTTLSHLACERRQSVQVILGNVYCSFPFTQTADSKALRCNQKPADGNGTQPPTAEQQAALNESAKLVAVEEAIILPSMAAGPSDKPRAVISKTNNGTWKATLLPPQIDSGNSTIKQISGSAAKLRTSKRNASTVDQDSMEKAAKLKAKRNLESTLEKGTVSGNPLASAMGKIAAA